MIWLLSVSGWAAASDWVPALSQRISAIDQAFDGNLGVYLKRLEDDSLLNYQGGRTWYLASTTKVLVAIALLQKQESGEISLERRLTLTSADWVDGSGHLLQAKPGERFTVRELLERMLVESDSTATDMLIRLIGEKELNQHVRKRIAPRGFGELSTILEVRRDAYGELHPRGRELSNLDFMDLKKITDLDQRLEAFLAKTRIERRDLKSRDIEDAFERYYQGGENSGTLEAFGDVLSRLARGELLSRANTDLMLGLMERMTTGEKRIKAGIPTHVRFAQKTGTQIRRICNVGLMRSNDVRGGSLVIAACAEKYDKKESAEDALRQVGQAIASALYSQPVAP